MNTATNDAYSWLCSGATLTLLGGTDNPDQSYIATEEDGNLVVYNTSNLALVLAYVLLFTREAVTMLLAGRLAPICGRPGSVLVGDRSVVNNAEKLVPVPGGMTQPLDSATWSTIAETFAINPNTIFVFEPIALSLGRITV